jgi:small subunit ribosomal protein S19|uniref:Small ribosomal subunit protein uS19m n=1 Tax=Chlorella vulgaris TaxID=3077 RepID=A0A650ANY3_CHLVU|nr:ribosomal protein S19 [Chlorella vulgaris]UNZ99620.1 ribosomal protein S19 [Chlorella vulgaris]USG56581.1 30S ribosomal protein S19 [Chlorella vulgaris]
MTRSLWKGPFSEIFTKNQKIWSRRSVILPSLIGKQLMIYNGKTFVTLKVTDQMIGHKIGEFAITRKKAFHKKKSKKK